MARKVYQIIIEILDAVYESDDKREYLVRNFIEILPQFPKIPTQYLIESYKEGCLKTCDFELIKSAINVSTDSNCLSKIGDTLTKLFLSQATLNYFLGPILFQIYKKILN